MRPWNQKINNLLIVRHPKSYSRGIRGMWLGGSLQEMLSNIWNLLKIFTKCKIKIDFRVFMTTVIYKKWVFKELLKNKKEKGFELMINNISYNKTY